MVKLYEGKRLEHVFYNRAGPRIVISGDHEPLKYSQAVVTDANVESVLKHYVEQRKSQDIYIRVCAKTYESYLAVAKNMDIGLCFKCGNNERFVSSISRRSYAELDSIASDFNISVSRSRFASSLAKKIPRSLSYSEAESIIIATFPGSEVEALDQLSKAAANEYREFSSSRSLKLYGAFVGPKLDSTAPGEQATQELRAFAEKVYVEGGLHVLQDGMGKGKTEHVVRELIKKAKKNGEKPTFLTHRIAISQSPQIIDLVSNYLDESIEGNEDKLDALSLTINQLGYERFLMHVEESKVVIIDEGAQVFRHFMQEGYKGASRASVFEALKKIFQHARLVLVCDAYVDSLLFEVLAISKRDVHFTSGQLDNSNTSLVLGRPSSAMRELLVDLKAKKVMVGCDSRAFAEAIESYGSSLGLKTLLISSRTKDNDDVKKFIKNPNAEIMNYDLLVHTSSMQSSVGITQKHFDSHYCFFSGVISIDDARQYIKRDRTSTKLIVGITETINYINAKSDSYKEVMDEGCAELQDLRARFLCRRSLESNNFQKWLSLEFEAEGYKISQLEEFNGEDAKAFKIFKQAKKDSVDFSIRSILKIFQTDEFVQGQGIIKSVDIDEAFLHDARTISWLFGKNKQNVTPSDVSFYIKGGEAKLLNLKCWLASNDEFSELLKISSNRNSSRNLTLRRQLIQDVMRWLGFTRNGDGYLYDEELQHACKYINQNSGVLQILGLVTGSLKSGSKTARQRIISSFLNALGLSKIKVWDSSRTRSSDPIKAYIIEPMGWVEKLQYLNLEAETLDKAS